MGKNKDNHSYGGIPEEYAKAGVYQLICKPTGEFYVGCSQNIRQRLYNWSWEIKRNQAVTRERRRISKRMLQLFQEYPKLTDWKMEVLEFKEGLTKHQLESLEITYIKSLNPTLNSRSLNSRESCIEITQLMIDSPDDWKVLSVNDGYVIGRNTQQVVAIRDGKVLKVLQPKGRKTYVRLSVDGEIRTFDLYRLWCSTYYPNELKSKLISKLRHIRRYDSEDLYLNTDSPRFQTINIRNFLMKK